MSLLTLPELIINLISIYQWRSKIKSVNQEYHTLWETEDEEDGAIMMVYKLGTDKFFMQWRDDIGIIFRDIKSVKRNDNNLPYRYNIYRLQSFIKMIGKNIPFDVFVSEYNVNEMVVGRTSENHLYTKLYPN